jgi:hypothetical protein
MAPIKNNRYFNLVVIFVKNISFGNVQALSKILEQPILIVQPVPIPSPIIIEETANTNDENNNQNETLFNLGNLFILIFSYQFWTMSSTI